MTVRSSTSFFFFTAGSFDSTLEIFYLRRIQKEILSLSREIKNMLGGQLLSSAQSAESKSEFLRGSVALSRAMDFMKVLDQTVREMYDLRLELDSLCLVQRIWIYAEEKPAFLQIYFGSFYRKREINLKVLKVPKIEQKALVVIEYLIANRSEKAVDDIMEHSHQIMSLSGFEYVEPNGKDLGINVRKKVETILALIEDKEKNTSCEK